MCNFASDKGHGGVRVVSLPRDILSKVREKTDVFGLARASVLLLFNILNYWIMGLMEQVLQGYCNKGNHTLEECYNGYRVYYHLGVATQVDICLLVEYCQKYGWHFYIKSKDGVGVFATIYEPILPLAS